MAIVYVLAFRGVALGVGRLFSRLSRTVNTIAAFLSGWLAVGAVYGAITGNVALLVIVFLVCVAASATFGVKQLRPSTSEGRLVVTFWWLFLSLFLVTDYCMHLAGGGSALCGDGSVLFSGHTSGTCSHHSGVGRWLNR